MGGRAEAFPFEAGLSVSELCLIQRQFQTPKNVAHAGCGLRRERWRSMETGSISENGDGSCWQRDCALGLV